MGAARLNDDGLATAWRIQSRFRPDPDQHVDEGIVNPQEVRSTVCTQKKLLPLWLLTQ